LAGEDAVKNKFEYILHELNNPTKPYYTAYGTVLIYSSTPVATGTSSTHKAQLPIDNFQSYLSHVTNVILGNVNLEFYNRINSS
jgi:hypothetical protein